MTDISFSDIAIVSCGTLTLELNHLRAEGFLDTQHLFFTTPGLHEDIHELERQLIDRITKAKEKANKVLVVYGGKFCYVNADENFPRHSGGAVVLDGVGYLDTYMADHPEDFLDYSDWMGIPIIPYPVTLARFKTLLVEQAEKLLQ